MYYVEPENTSTIPINQPLKFYEIPEFLPEWIIQTLNLINLYILTFQPRQINLQLGDYFFFNIRKLCKFGNQTRIWK